MTALSQSIFIVDLGYTLFISKNTKSMDLEILDTALSVRDQNCTAVAEIGLECAIPDLLTDELWQKQQHFFGKSALFSEEIQSVGQFT